MKKTNQNTGYTHDIAREYASEVCIVNKLDSNTIPSILREQHNILIQLGSLTSNQMQYVFPNYEHFTMLVLFDEISNKDRGIISINNKLFTFLVPTIKERIA